MYIYIDLINYSYNNIRRLFCGLHIKALITRAGSLVVNSGEKAIRGVAMWKAAWICKSCVCNVCRPISPLMLVAGSQRHVLRT